MHLLNQNIPGTESPYWIIPAQFQCTKRPDWWKTDDACLEECFVRCPRIFLPPIFVAIRWMLLLLYSMIVAVLTEHTAIWDLHQPTSKPAQRKRMVRIVHSQKRMQPQPATFWRYTLDGPGTHSSDRRRRCCWWFECTISLGYTASIVCLLSDSL